jgi:hypothetical protein
MTDIFREEQNPGKFLLGLHRIVGLFIYLFHGKKCGFPQGDLRFVVTLFGQFPQKKKSDLFPVHGQNRSL